MVCVVRVWGVLRVLLSSFFEFLFTYIIISPRGVGDHGALGCGSNRRHWGDSPELGLYLNASKPRAALRVAHVKIDKPVRQISMKDTTACCVTEDGEVWHWGSGVFLPQLVREVKFRNLSSQVKGAFCGSETIFISIGKGGHNYRRFVPSADLVNRRDRYLADNTVFSIDIDLTE